MSDMRTPLKRVRGLGSARSGTEHFWHQRLTAMANVPLVVFLVLFIISHLGASRADVLLSLNNPLAAVGLLLALVSITWHMWLGMQTIIEDYVHAEGRKIILLILNTFYAMSLAACGGFAVLKMGFGY